MLLPYILFVNAIIGLAVGKQSLLKLPDEESCNASHRPPVHKVAIIGAGIAGASAAYRLREQISHASFHVTIFEANSRVGGRIKPVKVFDGAETHQEVEAGAEFFYTDDECVQALIDETGLRRKLRPRYPKRKPVGVWDGASFVLTAEGDLKARSWTDWARFALRYGVSVYKIRKWLTEKLPLCQSLLGYEYNDRNIRRDIERLGLTAELRNDAWSIIQNLTTPRFANEVLQATTRAWNGQDLAMMHGLAALQVINPAETDSMLNGGNIQLIERLIKLSDADLQLQKAVTKIRNSPAGKYRLTVKKASQDCDADQSRTDEETDFDAIIIAAPLQMAQIEIDLGFPIIAASQRPYTSRSVTYFTSSEELSPAYFGLTSSSSIPSKIYTTSSSSSSSSSNTLPPPFFSIEHSYANLPRQGCVLDSEDMYKVVTATPLANKTILSLLGYPDGANGTTLEDAGVRWVHREKWHYAFPEYSNRQEAVMLDDFEIADGIYYTGIGDEVVTSLEMSCKMGRRAADLLYYERLNVARRGGEIVP